MKLIGVISFLILFTECTPEKAEQSGIVHTAAVNAVAEFCKARVELSAEKMEKYIADDFYTLNEDGSVRLYDRETGKTMCEWEKVMNSRWTYEILGVNDSIVTVLLKEKNDYFTLLGMGGGVQVSEYTVGDNGKLKYWKSKLFITENSTQGEALSKFRNWLLSRPALNEPTLIRSDGSIIFNGEAAPRMLYWMKEYRKASDANP